MKKFLSLFVVYSLCSSLLFADDRINSDVSESIAEPTLQATNAAPAIVSNFYADEVSEAVSEPALEESPLKISIKVLANNTSKAVADNTTESLDAPLSSQVQQEAPVFGAPAP